MHLPTINPRKLERHDEESLELLTFSTQTDIDQSPTTKSYTNVILLSQLTFFFLFFGTYSVPGMYVRTAGAAAQIRHTPTTGTTSPPTNTRRAVSLRVQQSLLQLFADRRGIAEAAGLSCLCGSPIPLAQWSQDRHRKVHHVDAIVLRQASALDELVLGIDDAGS